MTDIEDNGSERLTEMNRMKQRHPAHSLAKSALSAIMLAALTVSAGANAAPTPAGASKTAAATFTGELTSLANCTIVSVPAADGSITVPGGSYPANYTKQASMTVNCSSGTAFTLRAPAEKNRLDTGSTAMDVELSVSGGNIAIWPAALTGTGANQNIPIDMTFSRSGGGVIHSGIGYFSGTVVLTIGY